jgi:hypothetical protein
VIDGDHDKEVGGEVERERGINIRIRISQEYIWSLFFYDVSLRGSERYHVMRAHF